MSQDFSEYLEAVRLPPTQHPQRLWIRFQHKESIFAVDLKGFRQPRGGSAVLTSKPSAEQSNKSLLD